jgi:putative two-component system response regulator
MRGVNHRILLIDDKEPLLFALSDYFGAQGFQVDCARTAETARTMLAAATYSLVITDLRLTGTESAEGLEIVGHVRERFPDTATVLLTAYGTPEVEREARKRGVHLILPKPQALPELKEKVVVLLEDRLVGTVMVVEDDEANRDLLHAMLSKQGAAVVTASDGEKAIELLHERLPDLLLTDVQMPHCDGFSLCRYVKSNPDTRLLPVVMMTGLSAVEDKVRGIRAGADDFLIKPVERVELIARVRSLLHLKSFTDELDRSETVLETLANSIEAKDPYTQGHCERLSALSVMVGRSMGLPDESLHALRRAGALHDIGKVAVPDAILLKPGPLTAEEFAIMRQHPEVGELICAPLRSLKAVLPIIRHHHEKFDGSGYPDRLTGTAIPLTARILSIVDVYDALTTDRPYRAALAIDDALGTMRSEADRGWWDKGILSRFETLVRSSEHRAAFKKGA